MSSWRPLQSLGAKFSLAFSLVVAASAAVLVFNSYITGKEVLERESSARYESIVTNVAFSAEYGVLTRNTTSLQQMARGVMREKDVNFVEITDMNGEPLAKAGAQKAPSVVVSKPVVIRRLDLEDDVEYLFGGINETGRRDSETGKEEKVGTVSIEFNTKFQNEKLDDMRWQALLVSLFAIVGGVILTSLLARFLLSPLEELAHATAKVAHGELDFQIQSRSKDEIGELADAFNTMTLNLKQSTVSRDYLDSLLDAIPDAILVVNEGGTIQTVNRGVLMLSGREEKALIGAPLTEILSLDKSFVKTRTGETIPVSISRGALRAKDGRPVGVVYVAHDMRPMQKLQERLLQTEKMAAVGQLAAGVSHEINNPLGVILGFAQGLVRRLEAGNAMEIPLKSIEREAMRCKDLVQDLLTFSRTSNADREPMDLNKAVEGALSLIQAQARMDRAEVQQVLTDNLPRIYGSKNQIQQIIINLAKNALDAMPKGGMVTVKTELEEGEPHSWVCLRVQDTGTGIPQEVLPRIFEPFFTTKPVGKGTGLGLSLVYEIVKKHSGLLDVKSQPGFTEFIVKLPARTGREGDPGAEPGGPEKRA
jgi:signal transduction histidine kinase/HAMP domain-containing protein